MNSLNILSSHVIGQTPSSSPVTPRQRSFSEGNLIKEHHELKPKRSASQHENGGAFICATEKDAESIDKRLNRSELGLALALSADTDEKTPLLGDSKQEPISKSKYSRFYLAAKRLADAIARSLRWVLSTLSAPGVYAVNCLYDDRGQFSPFYLARKLGVISPKRNGSKSTTHAVGLSGFLDQTKKMVSPTSDDRKPRRRTAKKLFQGKGYLSESVSSTTSDSEVDGSRRARSVNVVSDNQAKSPAVHDDGQLKSARRSIRIKAYNEDSARRRKDARTQGNLLPAKQAGKPNDKQTVLTAANLKSPTSPASSSLRMTKYPRALAPPRPLIPRRQPSYSSHTASFSSSQTPQKTLVIDLDETLIHSLAKGGRMSSGHMVEVKLSTSIGLGGTTLGPQHPILYYVHKRPHCDLFLRKVCKWYNLVVFTASVQEYADPVIDWLEQERTYFSRRYYRQHCTFRNGAYIKDLSSIEPDLSKVIILDNSPLSYIFHEGNAAAIDFIAHYSDLPGEIDNAIPIEGWINDPTDNDLLHLIPLLEGLQYVTDVRALLALRRGEAEASH